MVDKPFRAYRGDEPYVFLCYAHEDQDIVYPEIGWLHEQGVNLWYDNGISAGKVWRTEIAEALQGAAKVLYYISKASLASDHCNREINYALDKGVEVLPVYLEEIDLTAELDLALSRIQALHRDLDANYQQHLLDAFGARVETTVATSLPDRKQLHLRRDVQITLAILALISGGWWYWDPVEPEVVDVAQLKPLVPSIAVLPFVNISADPEQEFFVDGITEDLIDRLANVTDLRVIARTSSFRFKGKSDDVREIGQMLGVGHLVDGSVRRVGNTVRIAAQLVRADDGTHIWSNRYDRELEDVLELQDEITLEIATQLTKLLKPLKSRYQPSPEAYEQFLRGRRFFDQFRHEEALEHFTRAVELDPDYADAHAEIAFMRLRASPDPKRRQQALDRALSLDPEHVGALATRALLTSSVEHDHQRAIDLLHDLVTRAPNNQVALQAYMDVLLTIGRDDLYVAVNERLLTLDPLSYMALGQYAHVLARVGRWDEARQIAAECRSLGVTTNIVSTELDFAAASGDLAVIPGLLAEARELQITHWAEPAYYIAIGDDASFTRLKEEIRNQERQLIFMPFVIEDESARTRVWEAWITQQPLFIWSLRSWTSLTGKDSIGPWKEIYQSDDYKRLLQKFRLDDESVAKLKVPPLPF